MTRDDEGKIFRCGDTANVTVTISNDLPEGFNCGFVMYNTGTITLAASPHVVNRSAKTALSTQYQTGSIMVMQRTGGNFGVVADIEYLTGGDFA
ncbi:MULTISPECIES: hypothetical protein [unclassified Bradyrhizobium]|uniref:hypothetical protein n=1 Tax=unclassified Bradyrhizobium TaxID=2631580 RepID=UPI001FF939C6|nr:MULTISPECIES: hypothetical protein [unclassified Bradyrhizobium]MCK1436852.1 hypothetical protein [Bradyrhizobium sp. 15]MCK1611253.1 hypothetical protein [Bradyrhizobium sp. 163]MCK1761368.1 hypothetical protein [Bradyrhizobium sp. 136]